MARSKSSRKWLHEHFSDTYVKKAQAQGLRARASFKLQEIQTKYRIMKPGMIVVDLGAAPGSWSEFASDAVGTNGKVFALDILAMPAISGVEFIQGDFNDQQVVAKLLNKIAGQKVDVVISDIAPNISGIPSRDQALTIELVENALNFALQVLKPNGTFLSKIFQGEGFQEFYKRLQQNFAKVKSVKPDASRARSREVYLLAQHLK